jgi:hypothetical protein
LISRPHKAMILGTRAALELLGKGADKIVNAIQECRSSKIDILSTRPVNETQVKKAARKNIGIDVLSFIETDTRTGYRNATGN